MDQQRNTPGGPSRGLRPGAGWLAGGESGMAILMMTTMLSVVALSLAISHFKQTRSHRFELMRQRAEICARYASEYAVARYGIPNFMQNPDLADQGDSEDNWIAPRNLDNFMGDDFQNEDDAHGFTYSYRDLKMDKVFDVTSSKPYYFISAQGFVTYTDTQGVQRQVSHTSAVGLTFSDFSRFMYFSNGEFSPENGQVTFGVNEQWYGRVHINGQAAISTAGQPIFHGLFSQTEESVINLSPGQYEQVFQGGWIIPHPEIQWPPTGAIDQIKEQRLPNHSYADKVTLDNGRDYPLTTWLKFDRNMYHVAQYISDSLTATGDTIYIQETSGLNWMTKNLPTAQGHEMIYVKGVCRLQGIVRGKITVLASDSMFIMDNIVTEDVILNPCPGDIPPVNGTTFGMVPVPSPNRIGLACEKDIIIASTFPNGFGNGAQGGGTCNIPYVPGEAVLGNLCGTQARRDIIITAAIFAVGCSFEAEFWNHTAFASLVPPLGAAAEGCGGPSFNQMQIWQPGGVDPNPNDRIVIHPCPTAIGDSDRRGTVYICGSIVQTHRGFVIRNPAGPFGNGWIGYPSKAYRYDDNYLSGGPPVWFRVSYADGSQEVATEMVVPDYERWRKQRAQFLED